MRGKRPPAASSASRGSTAFAASQETRPSVSKAPFFLPYSGACVSIISMGGFTVVTLFIGLLPGYETWGMGSIVILALLRFVDGVFLGGEYTGANPGFSWTCSTCIYQSWLWG